MANFLNGLHVDSLVYLLDDLLACHYPNCSNHYLAPSYVYNYSELLYRTAKGSFSFLY